MPFTDKRFSNIMLHRTPYASAETYAEAVRFREEVIDRVICGEMTPSEYNAESRYREIRFPKSLRSIFHLGDRGIGILKRMQEEEQYHTAGCLLSKHKQVSPGDYTLVDTIARKDNRSIFAPRSDRTRLRPYKVTRSGFEVCPRRPTANLYCLNKGPKGLGSDDNRKLLNCRKPVLWIALHNTELTILGFYVIGPFSPLPTDCSLVGYVELVRL